MSSDTGEATFSVCPSRGAHATRRPGQPARLHLLAPDHAVPTLSDKALPDVATAEALVRQARTAKGRGEHPPR